MPSSASSEEHKSNFDQRREMRLKRKAALKALKDNRPAADADDPKVRAGPGLLCVGVLILRRR